MTYLYTYNDGQLTGEVITTNGSAETLYYSYDASGTPVSVKYNNTLYFYLTNLQGDVIAIMNGSGTIVVEYTYDAWGYIRNTSGTMANTLGKANALRYRGYVYDTETCLYYLQSRYYNPGTGRFINADALVATGQGLLGNNMFAYCSNNPIILIDASGKRPVLYCYEDPAAQAGKIIAEIIRTDEDETDEDGNPTPNAKIKKAIKILFKNIEASAGLGMGFELEAEIAELLGAGIGMHVDMFSVHLERGELSFGQEYSAGVFITGFMHTIGFVEHSYNKNSQPAPVETNKGLYGDEILNIASVAFYFGIGGSVSVGFDVVQMIKDFEDTFK